jgi:hypothetical protein
MEPGPVDVSAGSRSSNIRSSAKFTVTGRRLPLRRDGQFVAVPQLALSLSAPKHKSVLVPAWYIAARRVTDSARRSNRSRTLSADFSTRRSLLYLGMSTLSALLPCSLATLIRR